MNQGLDFTRRDFFKTAALVGFPGLMAKEGEVDYPPYPTVSGNLDHGWQFSKHARESKNEANWSFSYYNHSSLREKVAAETDGLVNIELSGFVAMRIGDTKDATTIFGKPDSKFDHMRFAWMDNHESVKEEVKQYLSQFSKSGFNPEGGINLSWILHLMDLSGHSPPGVSALLDLTDSGPASISVVASGDESSLTRYSLEYAMTPDSVNSEQSGVTLSEEKELPFTGWFGSWGYNGHLYAVSGIHPRQNAIDEEFDRPYLDAFFSELTGKTVSLEIDYDLPTQMHNLMGRIR